MNTTRRITTRFGAVTAMLLAGAVNVTPQASFSGVLASDTTWRAVDSPIQVTGNLTVPAGTTLTIEPGVVVQFAPAKVLQVNGTVVARGTAAAQIRFTSAQTPATAGDWGPVRFTDTSVDTSFDAAGNYISGSVLEYVVIEGGGAGPSDQSGTAVDLVGAAPLLKSLTLQNNRGWGVNAWFDPTEPPSTLKILDSEIASQTAGGINIHNPNQVVVVLGNWIHGDYAVNEEGIGIRLYSNVGQGGQAVLGRNTITTSGTAIDAATTPSSTLELTDNTLVGNKAGIVVTSDDGSSTVALSGNVVQGSWRGGGVRLSGKPQDAFTVTGNTIIQNVGVRQGAGLYLRNSGPTTVTNNVISDNISTSLGVNSAAGGGGVYVRVWSPTPTANTFANNLISRNSGLTYGGLYAQVVAPAALDIRNNTITQNRSTLQNRPAVGVSGTTLTVRRNNIFGNVATYAFEYLSGPSFPVLDATNNWWGTSDAAAIQELIYDFEDNGQYAPVTAMPALAGIDVAAPVSSPTGLTVTPAAGSVTLNWTANPESDVAGYRVWYGAPGGPWGVKVRVQPNADAQANEGLSPIDVGNVTSFTLTGLPAGTFAATVTAYDVGRDGATDQTDGNESWFAADPNGPPAPGAPSNPSPAAGATNVDTRTFMDWAATWSAAAGAVSYNVAFGTTNPPAVQATDLVGTTWRWGGSSSPRLAPSTTYYWWVAAIGADGAVTVGPIWSFTTSAGTLPETPHDGRAIRVTRTSAELEWAGSFALGFDVEFGTSNPPAATVQRNGGTTYGAQNLSPGTTYYWRVTARNEAGTAVGPVWSFTTSALPEIHDDPSPAHQATNVPLGTPLTWSATGAMSYDVSLRTILADEGDVVAAAVGLTSASFGPPLSPGTRYSWQVIARNAAGATTGPAWWFITGAATPPSPAPGGPSTPTAPDGATGPTGPTGVTGAIGATLASDTSNVPAAIAGEIPATNSAPTLTGLNPSTVAAGSGAFTLRVLGTGFIAASVVRWDGGDRATTRVSAAELRTTIASGDVAGAGAHTVTVFNPAPGGGISNSLGFTVIAPPIGTQSFSGVLASDTTWRLVDSPIQVTGNLTVPAGTTLTIEPGVVVQFAAAKVLQVNGTVVARGTPASRIRLTSKQVPVTAGSWGTVRFTDTSVDASFDAAGSYLSGSVLEYVAIEGGGAGPSNQYGTAVDLVEAAPLLKSLTLQNNRGWGVNAWFDPTKSPSTLKILDSEIASRTAGGINIHNPNQVVVVLGNWIHGDYAVNEEGIGIRLYSNVGQGGQAALGRNTITTSGTAIDAATTPSSTLELTDNTLTGNKAGIVVTGGGSSTVTLSGNVVQGNWRAGGVRLSGKLQDAFTVTGNTIIQNEGYQNGAGLYLQNQGPTTVADNIISDNKSTNLSTNIGAGGVYLLVRSPAPTANTLANNLISRNSGLTYGGLYAQVVAPATLSIRNNTITQNRSTLQNRPAVGVSGTTLTVQRNNIFGNVATYAFEYLSGPSFPVLDATNNWWGTSDAAAIQELIYDFEDNGQYAPVTAMPALTGIDLAAPVSPPAE